MQLRYHYIFKNPYLFSIKMLRQSISFLYSLILLIIFLSFLLYRKGFIYLEVPIHEDDHVVLPPLEGFVMNRVLGDYIENLLYKIFVSIDERTSVGEVSTSTYVHDSFI
jgi:hypothetical protein